MEKSLRSLSFNKFKANPTSYIAIGVMCGLFLVLAMVFSFLDPAFLVIAIPLLAMPFLFASHIGCYYLQINQPITISAFFRYFVGFFRMQFRGSFRGLISFLKAIAFYFLGIVVATIVIYMIFKAQHGEVFTSSLNRLIYEYVSSPDATYEDIINILNENDGLLLTFITYISTFGIPLAMLAFIYHISFSSLSIYYRANVILAAPALIKMSIANTYGQHRHNMSKDWFKLNWPILVLSFLGMAAFAAIDILLIKRIDLLPGFVIVGGVSLLMFYLPFYFVNMETIYAKYEENFKQGNQEAINSVLQRIQNSIDLSEEEKKALEESLRGKNEEEEK